MDFNDVFEELNKLEEGFGYANHIDQNLLAGVDGQFGDGSNLITDNDVKCSRSAINNVLYFLKHNKPCTLCLGSFTDQKGGHTKDVSHVWVEAMGKLIQTHVPNSLIGKLDRLYKIKCIDLKPADLANLKEILENNL